MDEKANTTKSFKVVEKVLADVDAQLKVEQAQTPADDPLGTTAAVQVESTENAFLTTIVFQLTSVAVEAAKATGWSSPAVPGVLTEEQWKSAFTDLSVKLINKHFPSLGQAASPEVAWIALVAPWIAMNFSKFMEMLKNAFGKLFGRKQIADGTSHSNTGSNGNGKDNDDAKASGFVPSGLPVGSHA